MRLYVTDADAVHAQAVAAGGTSLTDVTPLFFGDRVGRVRDPLGNVWWIQSHVEDVDAQEMGRRAGQPGQLVAMAYVQSTLVDAMESIFSDCGTLGRHIAEHRQRSERKEPI